MALLKTYRQDMVDIYVYDTNENMGVAAADAIEKTIHKLLSEKSEISIIVCAGPSQFSTYEALKAKKTIDWTRINMFHLDEVIGLSADDPTNLKNHIEYWFSKDLPFKNKFFLDTSARDLHAECRRYSKLLKEYHPEIVMLGIGVDGHLALNEPGISPFDDPETVKVVKMDERTRRQSMSPGGGMKAPVAGHEFGMTITLPVLMKPKYKFCIVPYSEKEESAYNAMFGSIDERCPASIVRTQQNVMAFFDKESAARFPKN